MDETAETGLRQGNVEDSQQSPTGGQGNEVGSRSASEGAAAVHPDPDLRPLRLGRDDSRRQPASSWAVCSAEI